MDPTLALKLGGRASIPVGTGTEPGYMKKERECYQKKNWPFSYYLFQSFQVIIQYYYLSHPCFRIDAKDVFALLKKAGNPGHNPGPGEEPTFTWFKSGQEFDPEDRFKVLFKDEEDTLALVFQHINPEDAGLYTCVASTSTGKISCSAELSVEGGVTQLLKVTLNTQVLIFK